MIASLLCSYFIMLYVYIYIYIATLLCYYDVSCLLPSVSHFVSIFFGKKPFYVISDVDLLKDITVKHFDKFPNRMVSDCLKYRHVTLQLLFIIACICNGFNDPVRALKALCTIACETWQSKQIWLPRDHF